MERRYYLVKVAIFLLAIVTVAVTSDMGSTRMAHAINLARYSASVEIQDATWHGTANFAHSLESLLQRAAMVQF